MKTKNYFILLLILSFKISLAQVGIGTTIPDAQLDIRSSNSTSPAIDDGILIPKVDNLTAVPTIAQQGMLVYLTSNLSATFQKGFYYWDFPTLTWIGISSTANGDKDWYEVGTTTAPNDITDNMFHLGNTAIGKNTANFPLEITNSIYDIGVNNDFNNATTNSIDKSGISNTVGGTTNDVSFGLKNSLTGSGTGTHFANYNLLSGTGNGNQYGIFSTIPNTGNGTHYGNYSELTGSGMGAHFGAYNLIYITNNSNSTHTGVHNQISGTSNGEKNGTINEVLNTGNGVHVGTKNLLYGSGSGVKYGTQNYANTSGTANNLGIYNQLTGTSSGYIVGLENYISNNNNGNHFGINNSLGGSGDGLTVGMSSTITTSGTGNNYGTNNEIYSSGSGNYWGTRNIVNSNGNGIYYGNWNQTDGPGTGTKYASYNLIGSLSGGTHYGVYSSVLKPGATNFAGYFLGNVGVGTTIANTYILPPSRGTVGQIMKTDGTGNVTWANNSDFSWSLNGNALTNGGNTTLAGTNFIGTTDNQNIDFRTNNIYRGRFSSLGEFFVGTLNTALPGDLMNAVSNVTFPWAVNGYSSFNGGGVYGSITSGSTSFAAVQGEYVGTSATGSGVRGINFGTISGTSFANSGTAVNGEATSTGSYKFGLYGSAGTSTRSGGVFGYNYGLSSGALGYYSSGLANISVYGFGLAFTTGGVGGRSSIQNNNKVNTNIGLGIYGGVMGGWVRGLQYGFHTKGETYSLYVDGNGYTNKPLTYLIQPNDEGNKIASFMSTSLQPEVTVNGKINLINGKVFVAFDKSFQQIISNVDDIIITASPQGKSNGVYIDSITNDGFWIYENNEGVSNVKISWIAITKIIGQENPSVPSDLLNKDFDKKMDGVMYNENNTTEKAQSLWWDGTKIRWDLPQENKIYTEPKNSRIQIKRE